jgi:hypothetical protein
LSNKVDSLGDGGHGVYYSLGKLFW